MKALVTFCGLQERPNNKPPMILVTNEHQSTVEFSPKEHFLLNPIALVYKLHEAEFNEVFSVASQVDLRFYFQLKGMLDLILAIMIKQNMEEKEHA